MRKVFNEEEYRRLKEFIVTNSENPDANRCCIFMRENLDITICFNDEILTACICEIGHYSIDIGLDVDKDIFDYLLGLSEGQEIDADKLDFYERIEGSTECCEFNK